MANYSLVINSRFKPFSYQELLAPAMQATTAHQQVEEALAELDTKSSIWDKLTNPEADKVAHSLYTNYSKDLEAQAQELARNGLNPTSRQAMLNMRARYAKEITPIEQAYARRKELADEQRKMLATNPTMMYQRMANTMSLDDFIANPLADYGSSYSGAMLTQQVSQAAANLAKELTDYGKGKPVDKYTDTFLKQHGYKGSDVSAIIAALQDPNSEAGKTVLGQLRNSILESTGIGKWADEATMARANNYANQGLWSAVGQSDVTTLANFEAQENLRFAHQLALQKQAQQHAEKMARQQAQMQAEAVEKARMKMYDINPTTLYSASDIAKANKATAADLDKWRQKGYFNSKGQLTNKGWRMLSTANAGTGGQYVGTTSFGQPMYTPVRGRTGDPAFLAWAKQHGVTNQTDRRSVNILNNYYQGTRTAIAQGRLPQGSMNIDVYRQTIGSSDDRGLVLDRMTAAVGGDGKIYQAGAVTNGTIGRGKGFTATEFRDLVKDNPIVYVMNSPSTGNRMVNGQAVYGQQLVELSNGQKFILPDGLLGNDVVGNLANANFRIRNSGSAAERATELNRANSYLGSILTTTGGTEIKPNDGTTIIDLY